MTKKLRGILACIAVILLAAGWSWRYISLNSYYDSLSHPEKMVYKMGEIVPFGADYMYKGVSAAGYSVRVDGFEIADYETYAEGLDLDPAYSGPEKLALVYITLFNESSDAEGVMLTEFQLHGIDNYVGLSRDMLLAANPVLEGNYGIHLSPDTEYGLVIPFELYSELFGGDTWRHIENYEFFFHVTSYPTEKDIQVQ